VVEHFRHGVSHGLRTKWRADGTKKSEAEIVDGRIHGTFTEYYPNGIVAREAAFSHGEPHGVSRGYYESGWVKTEVVMDSGRVVKRTNWADGEQPGENRLALER
jgi:antitoxin component YwqK of YwqJK toxin-antitoxin module